MFHAVAGSRCFTKWLVNAVRASCVDNLAMTADGSKYFLTSGCRFSCQGESVTRAILLHIFSLIRVAFEKPVFRPLTAPPPFTVSLSKAWACFISIHQVRKAGKAVNLDGLRLTGSHSSNLSWFSAVSRCRKVAGARVHRVTTEGLMFWRGTEARDTWGSSDSR